MHFVKWFWGLTRPGLSLPHYRPHQAEDDGDDDIVDNVDNVDNVINVDNVDNIDVYPHHLSARQDCHYLITRPPPQGFHFKGAEKRDLIVLLKKEAISLQFLDEQKKQKDKNR